MRALLLSETVLEKRVFCHSYVTTWAESDIRDYLNGYGEHRGTGFYDSFNPQDKEKILKTRIVTYDNPWYPDRWGGEPTEDCIFLLSLEEVCGFDNITGFGDSTANLSKKVATGSYYYIDDRNNSTRTAKDSDGEACWWWLRSPGNLDDGAAGVGDDGSVDVGGFEVDDDTVGVRPALWINL